jgi:hypothetical protein
MISSAFTKKVPTKGNIRVRYSKCAAIAQTNAAEEIKKKSQNMPVFLFFCSMNIVFETIFAKLGQIPQKVTGFLDS